MSTPGTVNFPTTLDDVTSLIEAANNAATTLTASASSSDTTLTVGSTTGFTSSGAVTIDGEIIYYTSKTSTTSVGVSAGVMRGRDGTTAAAHASGAAVEMLIVAAHHNTLAAALLAVETKLGAGGGTGAVMSSGVAGGQTINGGTASARGY